ncbi:MAG TPA: hypothetical protein VH143_14995 [Kofleriaceae bacterium]|jgi:hypothetical protein|nr:hypothetical protein [Kofleriaceae bacterium]
MSDPEAGRGELAALQERAKLIPAECAATVKEVAQREAEVEARAHDGLLVRGNTLLAASGVALSLLLGLSKDIGTKTGCQKLFLVGALALTVLAGLLVLIGTRLVKTEVSMKNATIMGAHIPEDTTAKDWPRAYALSLALAYCEHRMNLKDRHNKRGNLLRVAQWSYFGFLLFASLFGFSVIL